MKIGLSLSGGGANGAFHYGAIKALNDYGFNEFNYVSGISAGAIAGSMANDLHLIKDFYDRITGRPEEILDLYFTDYKFNFSLLKTAKNINHLFEFQSLSSNCKLSSLIKQYQNFNDIDYFGVGLVSLSTGKYEFIEIDDMVDFDEFEKAILASASMVPIFKPVEKIKTIDGDIETCADGGFRVISPIINCMQMAQSAPLLEETIFIEINCRNNNPDKKLSKKNLFQYLLMGDSVKSAQLFQNDDSALVGHTHENVLTIQPKDSTHLPGKLDFSKESMNYMSDLGYRLTLKKITEWGKLQK